MDRPDRLPALSERELTALRGAAAWYAKYHAGVVADHAAEDSAYAIAEREEYLDLVAALGKLGVRVRVPDALASLQARAA
ncbi:MAG: hypothetical protein WD844_07220 [Thermoleophilaceae bacterium]